MHRLGEAYYLDEAGQPQAVSYMQCLQYMFVNYNIVVAIGVFCIVIGFALLGFWVCMPMPCAHVHVRVHLRMRTDVHTVPRNALYARRQAHEQMWTA